MKNVKIDINFQACFTSIKSACRNKIMHIFILGIINAAFFIPVEVVVAHPGNTAADGCHYCWTNCPEWGETYGVRHCHGGSGGGGYGGPTYSEQGEENGAEHATDTNYDFIVSSARVEGDSDGYSNGIDGSAYGEDSNSSELCSRPVNFASPQPEEYEIAFQDSYSESCVEIYDDAYTEAYGEGFERGETEATRNKLTEDQKVLDIEEENVGEKSNYSGLIIMGLFAAFYAGVYIISAFSDAFKKWWNS